jgi:hypothetical protein
LLRVWGRGEETDTIDLALMRRVIEETAGA